MKMKKTFKWMLLVIVIHQVLIHGIIGEKGCSNGCKYKNLPQPNHPSSVMILSHIIMNEKVLSILQCAEKCRDNAASQSCAYFPNEKTCYVFNIQFDDTGIALQLDFGWIHIYIRSSDRRFFIREKYRPCNQEYCRGTCLPGYQTRCVRPELIGGANCDQLVGLADSCTHLRDLTTFGKGLQQKIFHTWEYQVTGEIFLRSAGTIVKAKCWYAGSDKKPWLLVLPEGGSSKYMPRISYSFSSMAFPMKFNCPDATIDIIKVKYSCSQVFTIDFDNVYPSQVKFELWDNTMIRYADVRGCSSCDGWSSSTNYPYGTLSLPPSVSPVRQLVIENYLGLSHTSVKLHYLKCEEG